jgi:hypothetical protein
MNGSNYSTMALLEHRFWLQILGDHARFIHDTLAPSETKYINKAQKFIEVFDKLLQQARKSVSSNELQQLNKLALNYAKDIREFKLSIISEHLVGSIKIGLSPSFLNHMVNEVDEYIDILNHLVKNEKPPVYHPVHYHLVWLLDATGHAGAINNNLDATEKDLKEKSHYFTTQFEQFYLKAVEIAGFLRTDLDEFPALNRFNNEVDLKVKIFKEFIREIEELDLSKELLDTLSPLMADHMAREECYYLIKLAQSSDISLPSCDPTKPRTEA